MSIDRMLERTMQMFFGDKAYSIAGTAYNPKERKKWILKLINKLKKHVDKLDVSIYHKKPMFSYLDSFYEEVKKSKDPSWKMIFSLLRLCGSFLGYRGVYSIRPIIFCTPVYSQSKDQRYTEKYFNDDLEMLSDKNAISVKSRLVKQLMDEGLDTFNIGLILNISEYQVKKLKKYFQNNTE